MQISELNVEKKKTRKRVGRGFGSGNGKTAGRGHKGQGQRSGSKKRPWFEGGQMPLQRRVPKRGFHSRNKKIYQLVNVSALDKKFESGATVDCQALADNGLVKHATRPIKILGDGNLEKQLTVIADRFTKTAGEKISQAGGTAQLREAPAAATDASNA